MRRAVLPMLGILFTTLLFIPVVQANSDEVSRRVEQTSDYFVVVEAPVTFTARTLLCDEPAVLWCARPEQGGHFLDSALWLYDQAGLTIAVSDDDGISYASLISIALEPGVYRLRAGRYGPCDSTGCMHPEQPFPVGSYYELLTSLPLILDPTPPQASPDPIPSELPTVEPSPIETPSAEPSPTQTLTPEPSPSETATPEPTPTETPSPTPTETPTPSPSVEPSPSLTPSPFPTPVPPTPTATPTEVPTESPTPEPSPLESVTPEPSATPTPEPVPDNAGEVIGAAAEAVAEAVSEAVTAVTETIGAAVDRVANLGKDLTPAQKQEAAPVAVAVIISQVAGAAVAAATSSAAKGKSK